MTGNSKESFELTVSKIKSIAKQNGIEITNKEIADKLNIPIEEFNAYYEKDSASPELFSLLYSSYKDLLKGISYHKIWHITEYDDPLDPDDIPPLDPEEAE
ncbi:hypothetical protein [Chitinophaga sp. CF118]|uniref:hypothetical protein n=1 Tax=Chitinophaga sp. CF118 TaxID=1884367 RepID=UPI00116037F6|nr:hypothetical protein [Chitinophaga sp. CF118]